MFRNRRQKINCELASLSAHLQDGNRINNTRMANGSCFVRFWVRQRSWRDPAGESPAQVRGSARLVASVAAWKATTTAKHTQQLCEVCLGPRNELWRRAEAVKGAEGNMSGAAMRGTAALPESETSSRTKGSRRNLGDLIWPTAAKAAAGHDGKSRRQSRRGSGEERTTV
jgi:hypothetical protein